MLRLVRHAPVVALTVIVAFLCLGPASVAAGRLRGGGAQAVAPTAPTPGALYTDGPDGRDLLGGQWLFRLDPTDVGLKNGYASTASQNGWSKISVPSVWNATDQSDASMNGSVGWYRRDFVVPNGSPAALKWIVHFESVNFHAEVWLNGKLLGTNTGAYLPFEFLLANLNPRAVNRLVIRVDNRLVNPSTGPQPPYGWWNYGGLLGEVYLRSVDRVDLQDVLVRPTLSCARCNARILEQTTVRNYSAETQIVHVTGSYGPLSLDLGTHSIPAGQTANFAATRTLARPRLWSPADPYLYRARLAATAATPPPPRSTRAPPASATPAATRAAGYTVLSGVRSIRVARHGQLQLNYRPVHFRGVSIIEDNPLLGGAINNAERAQIIANARDLGATLIREQYPIDPELEELADRAGILLWSQIPIYQLSEVQLGQSAWTAYAREQLQTDILANQNHPSVAVWAIANELPTIPGPNQNAYVKSEVKLSKQLDPTRPVGISIAVNPVAGCQPATYAPLDLLGFDDYFGWYPGAAGAIDDRDSLSSYLDSIHACYPTKAIAITEFGAEANRAGPIEEKGTYAFQSDYAQFHLNVYATKPWLAGAAYFTLQEFRVQPDWNGGNPWPAPPIHQKGLISFAGVKKPAYAVVKQIYHGTKQYG